MAQADGTILIDTSIDTGKVKAGSKDIEKAVRRMADRVEEIGANAQAAIEKQVAAITKLNVQAAQQARKVDALKKKVKEYSKQELPTEEYAEIQSQIEKDTTALNRLKEAQDRFIATGGSKDSKRYKNLQYDIDALKKSVQSAQGELKELEESGKAFTSGIDTETAKRAMESLRIEQAKLRATSKSLQSALDMLVSSVAEYRSEIGGAVQSTGFLQSILNGLKMAAHAPVTMFRMLGQTLKNLPMNVLHATLGGVTSAFRKLGTVIKKCMASLLKFVGGKITSGLKKIANGIFGINKSANKTTMSLGKMLGTSLLFSSVFSAISAVTGAIKEGLGNVAQYSGSANRSISMLVSSLETLKNSFAAAFTPILNVVAPILSRFIDMISTAANYVGMFIARLTGQKTYTKAVAVQKDYAASLADTAAGASEAADATDKAAESAESYLSPLDEINKMDKKNTSPSAGSSGGGNGGSVGAGSSPLFEEIKVEPISFDSWGEAFSAFLDYLLNTGVPTLRNALTIMAATVNTFSANLYQMFTFPGVLEKVQLLGQEIAFAFNDFVNLIDWAMIGAALGAGLNLALQFLVNFIYTFDWLNLGASLATMLNNMIAQIDWYAFGQLLWSRFKIAIETLAGFLLNLDMVQLAQSASQIAMGFFNSITETLQSIDWAQLGEQVKTFLVNVDWAGVAESVFTAMGAAFGALAGFLWGLLHDAWDSVVNWWKETAFEDGQFTITGLLEGIVDIFKNIGTWIYDHIFKPFIDGFKSIFGIHSPSTVMSEMGSYLMQGLFEGISSLIDKVLSVFGAIRDGISAIWNGIKSLTSTVWNGIKSVLSGIWNGLKSGASTAFNAIKSVISSVWNGIKSITSSIWNGIKNTISSVINGIIGGINGMIRGIVGGLNAIIRALNRLHFDIPSWVPVFGGKTFGFNIGTITAPQIPYLASGAVIPPNKEFMAVLGDQKHGTNIETPEALLRKIMREVMREELSKMQTSGGGSYSFTAQLNRRTLFEEFIKEAQLQQMRTGKNPLEFA